MTEQEILIILIKNKGECIGTPLRDTSESGRGTICFTICPFKSSKYNCRYVDHIYNEAVSMYLKSYNKEDLVEALI